jgi:ferredoxin
MASVICEPCIGVCTTSCVQVCPVNCIIPPKGFKKGDDPKGKQLYINPEECIDCGACIPECPVKAIFAENDVPAKWQKYIQINKDFFKKK